MIARDKALHFAVGAGVFVAAMLLGANAPVAMVLVCLVAWGKERYGRAHPEKHSEDGWDAFASVAGAVVAHAVWTAFAL